MSDELIVGVGEHPAQKETAQASSEPIYQIRVADDESITSAAVSNALDASMIEVSAEVYAAATEAMSGHGAWYRDGQVIPKPAPPALPPPPIVLSADVLFFERMTDDEYDELDASVRAGETARVYRGWAAATSFTEGSDMWALLVRHLNLTVTAARRDELLARP